MFPCPGKIHRNPAKKLPRRRPIAATFARRVTFSFHLEREAALPVVAHADDRPPFRLRLVESLVEAADRGVTLVSPFARRVVVSDIHTEVRAGSRAGPL